MIKKLECSYIVGEGFCITLDNIFTALYTMSTYETVFEWFGNYVSLYFQVKRIVYKACLIYTLIVLKLFLIIKWYAPIQYPCL